VSLERDDIPEDWPVQPIDEDDETAADPMSCGTCGLTWDDAVITSMTPVPSARCPVESFHVATETLTNNPPQGCDETGNLYRWSTNYDAGTGPFALFLDLIGWSEEEGIGDVYDYANRNLGYVELDYLADALKEYADRPRDVSEYVNALMEAEREG